MLNHLMDLLTMNVIYKTSMLQYRVDLTFSNLGLPLS